MVTYRQKVEALHAAAPSQLRSERTSCALALEKMRRESHKLRSVKSV